MAQLLILEPDRRLGELYADYLRSFRHEVRVHGTAQQAISAADDARPDLVLCEVQLTNHSGIEFLYEFRSYEDWRGVPVIIVSQVPEQALGDSRQLLRHRLGVRAHLYKPELTLRDLRAAVDDALVAA